MHEDDDEDTFADGESGRTTRRSFVAGAGLLGAAALTTGGGRALATGADRLLQVASGGVPETTFRVRVENTSDEPIVASNGQEYPVVFSPGAYASHARGSPIFTRGEPERNNGLEEVAEDGSPGRLAEHLAATDTVADSGAFTTPVGADGPGPLAPGNAYEFEVTAGGVARYLSLASMFVPSNDLFVAVGDERGLALFEDGEPVTGDVTDRFGIWDAGTEVNEEPGPGENQIGNQPAPNVGLTERGTVAPIAEVNGYDYPDLGDVLSVRLSVVDGDGGGGGNGGDDDDGDDGDDGTGAARSFTVRLENVSTPETLQTSEGPVPAVLSPGAYAAHTRPAPVFFIGRTASPGLEAVAEDGAPGTLADELAGTAGVSDSGAFATPVGADGPGPAGPGGAYEFTVEAAPGASLSFATMFVQSNDLFYAPAQGGIPLSEDDEPLSGDVTNEVFLWDAGTEVNEEPGVGPNQAPRQSGPDTGADEGRRVRVVDDVNDGYDYPDTEEVLRVVVTPE